ncbi:MAG: hypothetical protein D6692_04735, partial [Planctomycetota bacterium]
PRPDPHLVTQTPPIPHPHAGPLALADYAEIARSARALRPVRRAERVATTGGWIMLLGGTASLPFSLGSGLQIALAAALIILGLREISLGKALRSLDPPTLKALAWNQIRLAIALTVYGVVNLLKAPPPSTIDTQLAGAAPELASLTNSLVRLAHHAVYAALIAGTWVAQGAQAHFYARTARKLRKAYAVTPAWIMRVHAAALSGRTPDPATVFAADAPGPAPTRSGGDDTQRTAA